MNKLFVNIKSIILFFIVFASFSYAQVQVTLLSFHGEPNSTKTVEMTVGDLTGLEVTSLGFQLNYDPSVLAITAGSFSGTVVGTKGFSSINPDNETATRGYIRVGWASGTPLAGAGVLIKLTVKFKASGSTTLYFGDTPSTQFIFNSGTPTANTTLGTATVQTVNNPPSIVPLGNKTIKEGEELSFSINANDPEGAVLEYRSTNLPAGATLDTLTGEFVWTPGMQQAGSYIVTFTVSDGENNSSANCTILVTDASAPKFNAIPDKTVDEGDPIEFVISASDTDNDPLTYSYAPLPSGAIFDLALLKFSWTPGMAQAAIYNVKFYVTDGSSKDSVIVKITVQNKNNAPKFTPISDYTVLEGENLNFSVIVTDVDGDLFALNIENKPSGATFSPATGVFNWTPTFSEAGVYNVIFSATDGFLTSYDTTKITVTETNRAPVFVDVLSARTIEVHNVPVTFTFKYTGTDPDGDDLMFVAITKPEGSEITADGTFSWTPTTDQAGGKQFILKVQVSDGDLFAETSVVLTTSTTITGILSEDSGIPTETRLMQNYPNPFNPTTNIKFSLTKESNVTLRIYNTIGEEVTTLINKVMPAGFHTINFDASRLSNGMYIYRIEADNFVSVKKMLLVK